MKVTANLTETDICEAITEYLTRKGLSIESNAKIQFQSKYDQYENDSSISATVECMTKPKTTYRGESSDDIRLGAKGAY